MHGGSVPEPRFWKALVVTGLLVVPLSLLVRAIVPMNDLGWFLVAALSTLTIASLLWRRLSIGARALRRAFALARGSPIGG